MERNQNEDPENSVVVSRAPFFALHSAFLIKMILRPFEEITGKPVVWIDPDCCFVVLYCLLHFALSCHDRSKVDMCKSVVRLDSQRHSILSSRFSIVALIIVEISQRHVGCPVIRTDLDGLQIEFDSLRISPHSRQYPGLRNPGVGILWLELGGALERLQRSLPPLLAFEEESKINPSL